MMPTSVIPKDIEHTRPAIAAIVLGLLLIGPLCPARAQFFDPTGSWTGPMQNIEGFTVSGKGYAAAKPNLVEVDMDVSASSELTADAIVKFRDAKKRIHDAFTALKLGNVALEERGLLVDQKGTTQSPYWFGYQQNTRNKTEVQLSRKLVVRASEIRKMDDESVMQLVGRLLDVAQDAGAHVGPQNNMNWYYYRYGMNNTTGLVRFVLEDFDKLQEEAYEKAIADARARAERLARLSHVELGSIVAIREVAVPGDRNTNAEDVVPKKRLEMSKFQEIPVRVELLVRFDVHSKPVGKKP
jgi:uncharacterized protein YggE